MKTMIQNISLKIFALTFILFSSVCALAQDGASTTQSSTSVSHSESSGPSPDAAMWYSNPIVWVVGGIVLLLIIIMAVRSGKSNVSNTEVTRKTTTTTTVKED